MGVAGYPAVTQAQDDFFGTIDVDLDASADGDGRPYSLIGWITEKVSYGLEDPGPLFSRQEKELNKVETSLFAQLDTSIGSGTPGLVVRLICASAARFTMTLSTSCAMKSTSVRTNATNFATVLKSKTFIWRLRLTAACT